MYDLLLTWMRLEPDRCRPGDRGTVYVLRDGEWRMATDAEGFPPAVGEDLIVGTILEAVIARGWPFTVAAGPRIGFTVLLNGREEAPSEFDWTRAWLARYVEAVASERLAMMREAAKREAVSRTAH